MGGGPGQQAQVSPGLARAMRGLRGFAQQAASAYGKLGDTIKQLTPIVAAFGQTWARMRAALETTTREANACASAFKRCQWAIGGCIPVAAALTKTLGVLTTSLQAAGVASQTSFGSMAAAAGKASGAAGGMLAGLGALLVPIAGIAAVAATAYVAIFKWQEIPGWLKAILVVASPLVMVIRAIATAFNVATAPIRLVHAAIGAVTGSVKAAINGFKALTLGIVSGVAKAATGLVTIGPKFARSFAGAIDTAIGKLAGWARSAVAIVGRVGGAMVEAGGKLTSITGQIVDPLRRGAEEFAKTGAAAFAMAKASGLSVEQLTALGYAAEQSGSSVEAVADAVETVNAKLVEAQTGSLDAAKAFEQLGLNIAEFGGMNAEQRFIAIGTAIASLQDPVERAKAAQDAFGTSSKSLIEMFAKGGAGLAEMRKEAERLGLVMSGPQAASAKAMADAYKLVTSATTGLWRTLGAAVAPQLTATAKATADVIKAVTAWVAKNGPLIAQVFKVASAVAAVGATLTTLGSTLAMVTPGLVALAAAAGAGYLAWGKFGKAITDSLQPIRQTLDSVLAEAKKVFGGIQDAIQGGDLELAVKIAWLGAQKAWVEGLRAIATITGDTLGGIFNAMAAGDWQGAISQAWSAVQEVYLAGANAIDEVFVNLQNTIDGVITFLRQQLNTAMSEMAKFAMGTLNQINNVASVVARLDPTGKMADLQKDAAKALKGSFLTNAAKDPAGANATLADEERNRRLGRLVGLNDRTSGRIDKATGLAADRGAMAAAAAGGAGSKSADIDAKLQDALDKAKAARDAAMAQDAADVERKKRLAAGADAAASPSGGGFGGFGATFSAAALVAQNGGQSLQKDIAAATKATAAGVAKLVEADKKRQQQAMAAAIIPVA